MARKKKENADYCEGEQMDLIDVSPENAKEIIKEAQHYQKAQSERRKKLEEETASKQRILEMIHNANIKPVDGGKIKLSLDGLIITVTPRDELVRVIEEKSQ